MRLGSRAMCGQTGSRQPVPTRGHHLVMLASQCVLLSDGTIPVDTATLKEAVLYHAVAEQQEEDC
jgi:hypothetical protein